VTVRNVPGALLILEASIASTALPNPERASRSGSDLQPANPSGSVSLLFDINTKQRRVPNELLLDIKRLADTETDAKGVVKDLFANSWRRIVRCRGY
jgi:hypothetical protein